MQKNRPTSNALAVGLMTAILCFGLGSAYVVLRTPASAKRVVTSPVLRESTPQVAQVASSPATSGQADVAPAQNGIPAVTPVAQEASARPLSALATVPDVAHLDNTANAAKAAAPVKQDKGTNPPAKTVLKPIAKEQRRTVAVKTNEDSPLEPVLEPIARRVTREPSVRIVDQVDPAPTAAPVEKAVEKPLEKLIATPAAPSPTAAAQSTRAVIAEPLVQEKKKPVVTAANAQKAWVQLDDKTTVIVHKGDSAPGLGAYLGLDGKNAKFDSGTFPLSP